MWSADHWQLVNICRDNQDQQGGSCTQDTEQHDGADNSRGSDGDAVDPCQADQQDDEHSLDASSGSDEESDHEGGRSLVCPHSGCRQIFRGNWRAKNLQVHMRSGACGVDMTSLTFEERGSMQKQGLVHCTRCRTWQFRKSMSRHLKTCRATAGPGDPAVEPAHQHGIFGAYGDTCPDRITDICTEELVQWIASVQWEEIAVYKHAQQTITVPTGCQVGWRDAYCIPLWFWEQGWHEPAFKFSFMLIRMLAAPAALMNLGPGVTAKPSRVMKERLKLFQQGEWQQLWAAAHEPLPPRSSRPWGDEAIMQSKLNKAKHKALTGQLTDARNALMGAGLLSPLHDHVLQQLKDQHRVDDQPPPMPDRPHDVRENDKYQFDFTTIHIKSRHGGEEEVDTFDHVVGGLPKYKAAGQIGDRYEHWQAVPSQLLRQFCHQALNDEVPAEVRKIWKGGLLHAGDKQKLDSQGRSRVRPLVVGMAIRRIAGRLPCAQLKDEFARKFVKLRQLGVAVPSGIETAFKTVQLAIEELVAEADGDYEDLPVAMQFDYTDGFNNAHREHLMEHTLEHFPQLLRYFHTCYGEAGTLHVLWQSRVVDTVRCAHGVWQGDPLGMHSFCISVWGFIDELLTRLEPQHMFSTTRDSAAPRGVPIQIADDLTIVTRRGHSVEVAQLVQDLAIKHGVVMSEQKTDIYAHGPDDELLQLEFAEMGMQVHTGGLYRLLGAPIGSSSFITASNSHLQAVVNKTAGFLDMIDKIDHSQAKHLMLMYSGSFTMQHLTRLVSPNLLEGFAVQVQSRILSSLTMLLAAQTLTPNQRSQATLPENRGGLGYTSAHKTLHAGYIACGGDVARWLAKEPWPEARVYLSRLTSMQVMQDTVHAFNDYFVDHEANWRRGKPIPAIDPIAPLSWPKQHVLSQLVHDTHQHSLLHDMAATSTQKASWFASLQLRHAGAWVRLIPVMPFHRIESHVFRTMLCIRLMVPIPEADKLEHCRCGYGNKGSLASGTHYISQCRYAQRVSVHNETAEAMRDAARAAGFEVKNAEEAGWFEKDMNLRPFDLLYKDKTESIWQGVDITVGDPTRTGRLQPDERYFKPGSASAQLAKKKVQAYQMNLERYGPLKRPTNHMVVAFESGGGFTKSAQKWLLKMAEHRAKHQSEHDKLRRTWTAQDWMSRHAQHISWQLVYRQARGALINIRRSMMNGLAMESID